MLSKPLFRVVTVYVAISIYPVHAQTDNKTSVKQSSPVKAVAPQAFSKPNNVTTAPSARPAEELFKLGFESNQSGDYEQAYYYFPKV